MRYIIAILLLLSSSVFANVDPIDEVLIKEISREFDRKQAKELDKFVACVDRGTDARTCRDPHWCLYPDKFDTVECVWYKIKVGF